MSKATETAQAEPQIPVANGPGTQETASESQLADFLPYQLSVASNAVSGLIAERYRKRFALKVLEWRVMAVLGDAGARQASGRRLEPQSLVGSAE